MELQVEHVGNKRKRKIKEESTIFGSFDGLISNIKKKKIKSGVFLVKHINQTLENGSSTEVEYVLKRLIRGMGSSRANSRNGFFSVLVALLSTVKSMKVSDILNLVKKHLCITSNIGKTEEAEIYTGQILVFGALIRSGQFLSNATVEEQHDVLSNLLVAGQQRSYLPIAVYAFLEELLLQINGDIFHKLIWPIMEAEVKKPLASHSLENLYFLLISKKLFPKVMNSKLLIKTVGVPEIIHKDSIFVLSILLLEISKSFHVHHPVYKEFAEQLATSPLLSDFWTQGVEPWLAKPNKNRDLLTLHIFQVVLANLTDKSQISKMLSTNFLSMMVKHLTINTSPKPELTIEANKALRLVTESFTEDMQDMDEAILDILRKFLFYPGQLMFEKFTGTRTVQILSNKLKASGVKELATLYQNVVTCKKDKVTGLQGETEPWHTAERKYAGELLTKLISNAPAVQDDHEWKLDMMKFFLELGMFHPINKDENNVVSHLLAGSLKNNFFRLFDQHPKLALPRLNNLCNTQNAIIHYLDSLLKKKKWVQRLRKPWSPEAKASFQKMIAAIKELELPKNGLPQSTVLIFRTMLMQMGIHLFINPDLAIEVLEELHSCLNEIDTGKGKFDETSMEKEVQWVDVVVDLMLSLLSINNHTLRIMINWVFPHLCPFLTPLALKQIIQVLDPKSEEHPLIDSLDFDSDEDIASDEDITNDDDTANEEALSSDGKHDSDTDSNIEEAEEPANAELQRAVRQALGTADTITDTESLDLDDMDPEEGKRINKELAQAFKKYKSATNNRKSKKFPRKDKALSHFRVRVLDLIEIYISSEPSLESCLDLVMPLFHLLEYCIPNIHQKPLESRVRTCISKLTGLKKFEVGKVTQEQLAELASKLLSKGERTSLVFFDMNSKIAECCCFLVKASKHIPTPVIVPPIQWKMMEKIEVPPLTDVLRNALLDYFQNRGTLLQLELFQKLVQQMWDGNWIIATLLAYFANAPKIRPYKQYQAMELLKIFFKENRSLQTELSPDEEWKFSRPEQVLLLKSIKLLKQNDSYKQKSLCKLLELLSQVHHCGKKINIELSKNWHVLGQALQMYKKNTQDIASSTKKSINKMLSLLGLQIVDQEFNGKPKDQVQEKNADQESVIEPTTAQVQDGNTDQMSINESATADGVKSHPQTNGVDELSAQQDKRVKNKRLKQIAKNNILKKESTKLRTDAMSVGLQSIDFKGADYTAVRDEYLSSGDKYYPFFVKENTNMENLSQSVFKKSSLSPTRVKERRNELKFERKKLKLK